MALWHIYGINHKSIWLLESIDIFEINNCVYKNIFLLFNSSFISEYHYSQFVTILYWNKTFYLNFRAHNSHKYMKQLDEAFPFVAMETGAASWQVNEGGTDNDRWLTAAGGGVKAQRPALIGQAAVTWPAWNANENSFSFAQRLCLSSITPATMTKTIPEML